MAGKRKGRRTVMAIVVDHESEYKGEQKVRDAIAEHFSDEVVIYNNREVNGREYGELWPG
jgi:hypothetical protein